MGVEAGDRALETARKDFETWAKGPKLPLKRSPLHGTLYDEYMTQLAWMAWKARESAMNAQERELREALRKIADNYGGCHCHHDTPDCCENPAVGELCPHCIAEIALANPC